MITHYDISTGEIIEHDNRDQRDDAARTANPALQARLMTVEEALQIEQHVRLPAAVVMQPPVHLLDD